MSSHPKIPLSPSSAPRWASLFAPRDVIHFRRLVLAELRVRDLDVPGSPSLDLLPLGDGEPLDLTPLAQRCRDRPRRAWPALITVFFDRLLEARLDPEKLLAALQDFAAVRDRLKIRLHPASAIPPAHAPRVLLRPIAEGLIALLVADLDVANVSIPASLPLRWGASPDELFAIALANVRAEPPLTRCAGEDEGGRAVDLLAGPTPYASSHLLFFERYFQGDPRLGALVSVPERHVILHHPIVGESVLAVVPFLGATAEDLLRRGPGAISACIYWWRPGHPLELLPTLSFEGSLVVCPPSAFQAEVLDPILRAR